MNEVLEGRGRSSCCVQGRGVVRERLSMHSKCPSTQLHPLVVLDPVTHTSKCIFFALDRIFSCSSISLTVSVT